MLVCFLRANPPYRAGETAKVSADFAARLVRIGAAAYLIPGAIPQPELTEELELRQKDKAKSPARPPRDKMVKSGVRKGYVEEDEDADARGSA